MRLARFRVGHGCVDSHRLPVLNQHFIGIAAHKNTRTGIEGILHICFHGGLLGSVATTKATRTATLFTANSVTAQFASVIAERGTAIYQQLVLPVVRAIFRVDLYALLHGGETVLQR